MSAVKHYERMSAIAEILVRFGAIIAGFGEAIADVAEDLEPEQRERLQAALNDANAQLVATEDALDARITGDKLLEP